MRAVAIARSGVLLGLLLCLLLASAASAVVPRAHLDLHSMATPTSFVTSTPECVAGTLEVLASGPCDVYLITVTNVGSVATNGTPIQLVDTLPAGALMVRFEVLGQNTVPPVKKLVPLELMLMLVGAPVIRLLVVPATFGSGM